MPLRTARRVLASVEVPYLGRWQRRSLYGARRNALRASTELIRRRREIEDTEEFLEALERQRRAARIAASREKWAGRRSV
jgi:hypothetical protein